jgi:hypothetical protein
LRGTDRAPDFVRPGDLRNESAPGRQSNDLTDLEQENKQVRRPQRRREGEPDAASGLPHSRYDGEGPEWRRVDESSGGLGQDYGWERRAEKEPADRPRRTTFGEHPEVSTTKAMSSPYALSARAGSIRRRSRCRQIES